MVEEEAAPEVADKDLPPIAAPAEEAGAAPAVADKDLPPMAAPENEAGEVEAGPAAATEVAPPAAAPEDAEEKAASPTMAGKLPPMAALRKRRPPMGIWTAIAAMLAITGVHYPEIASGFTAYDCANATNRVDVYSLLEPAACPTTTSHHSVERTIFGEIVHIKTERRVPVYRCLYKSKRLAHKLLY